VRIYFFDYPQSYHNSYIFSILLSWYKRNKKSRL